MAQLIAPWQKALGWNVRPIAIVPAVRALFARDSEELLNSEMERSTAALLEAAVKNSGVEAGLEPIVAVAGKSSRSQLARRFIEVAQKDGAQIAAVAAHARKGFERWRLGSFAEALINWSTIPALIATPRARISGQVERILFPVDFSFDAKRAFARLLPWAERLGAEIVVFHQVENPVPPQVYEGLSMGLDPSVIDDLMRAEEERCERRLRAWQVAAEAHGVRCVARLGKSRDTVAGAIVEAAQEDGASLIAAWTRGGAGHRLLGSVARDVMLEARQPVLIMHARGGGGAKK
jgi:nucleotide-binding universal stress UspA family protein